MTLVLLRHLATHLHFMSLCFTIFVTYTCEVTSLSVNSGPSRSNSPLSRLTPKVSWFPQNALGSSRFLSRENQSAHTANALDQTQNEKFVLNKLRIILQVQTIYQLTLHNIICPRDKWWHLLQILPVFLTRSPYCRASCALSEGHQDRLLTLSHLAPVSIQRSAAYTYQKHMHVEV